jgi:superfamily II DNA helicase RecQ
VLFVSPERLCTSAFRSLISQIKKLRTIGLLCVDEAHCLSSWSYNFRPSFLRIRREIANIAPRSVLALTATASPQVQVSYLVIAFALLPTAL